MSSHSNHKDDADATDVEVEDTADGASSAIPLMAYPPDPDDASPTQDRSSATGLTPHLTLLPSIALVLSLQIGSGIFSAPSHVSLHVPSPGVGIAVWISAGCLVWTGAATFIELGLLIPKNGGAQEYLRAAWGEFTAFAFVWIYWIVARPAANGIVAGVGAEYVCGAFLAGRSGEGGANVSSWIVKPVALLGLWIVTVINCLGARVGPKVANGFVVLKIGVLLSIVGTGLVLLISSKAPATKADGFGWWTEQPVQGIESSGGNQSPLFWAGDFLIALFGALWCYGGWESIGFVTGEMKNPTKDLPRALNTSMTTVIIGFALMNLSLYAVLPMQILREKLAVAVEFGAAVFGGWGAVMYSVLVSISAWGALNANIFTGGRLAAAASRRGYFPSVFGKNSHFDMAAGESTYYESKFVWLPNSCLGFIQSFAKATARLRLVEEVPVYAVVANSLLASIFVLAGSFYTLVTFVGILEYTSFFLTAMGLFRIRRSIPSNTEKSIAYRTRTFNPLVFCILSITLVLRGLIQDPLQAIIILLALVATYGLWRLRRSGIEQIDRHE